LTPDAEATIRIDQCLFGYNDGHRLLASSRKLPEEAGSLLLVHSDLVAGAPLKDEAYWTGIPVPAARCYALMRTWAAPEMPRPGCVWTHTLLIAYADVARFTDLGVLKGIFARPAHSKFAHYGDALTVDPGLPEEQPSAPISAVDSIPVLRAVYAPDSSGLLPMRGPAREDAVFAVWSQQWPRLRRSFSFQTTGLSAGSGTRFSLRLVADAREVPTSEEGGRLEEWERTAADDLGKPGEFRRFIWRYGSDIRRGRERFRFVTDVFNRTRLSTLEGGKLAKILDNVVSSLPDGADGKVLKTDLVSGGSDDYSLLPPSDALDVLSYFIAMPPGDALPSPPTATLKTLSAFWPSRAAEILAVTDKALQRGSAIAEEIVPMLSEMIEPATFVALSKDHPAARLRLVRSNPQLLDSPGLEELPQPQLSELLDLLPDDSDLAGRVLDRILLLDDEAVAATFAARYPSLVADRVFDGIAGKVAGSGPDLPHTWMRSIGPALRKMLPGKMLERARTTSALAACAFMLDLNVSAGLAVSASDWAHALKRSHDDIDGQSKQRLNAYLLALALARPSSGCEPLFERNFENVHADIAVSRLPYDAFTALATYLPNLYWWQQWDTCLRLRKAVAEAYADNDLDPESFRRLTSDRQIFNSLVDIAADSKHGRRFMKRLGSV
jgi:hypothetical protein